MSDSRDFQKQRLARSAWLLRRCPARDKEKNREAHVAALKTYLDGVIRDAGQPVGEAKRRSEG